MTKVLKGASSGEGRGKGEEVKRGRDKGKEDFSSKED
jgi:hypothetical protein